jgi:ABC-type multidrug transport system fused ATPase/permease subunit
LKTRCNNVADDAFANYGVCKRRVAAPGGQADRMKAAPFEYTRAHSVDEACACLAADSDAAIIAGGQTLVPMMAMRLARPTRLVDIAGIAELQGIRDDGAAIVIGAATVQARAAADPLIGSKAPLLALALPFVGHAATRNRGTVGGSVATADPAAEIPLVLATLKGSIVVRKRDRRRRLRAVAAAADLRHGGCARLDLATGVLRTDHPAHHREDRGTRVPLSGGVGARAVNDAEIRFERVSKWFGESAFRAVDQLDLEIQQGEMVALLGKTGCGKSTTFNLIAGLMEPSEGAVRVQGLDPFKNFDDLRGRIAVVFQNDRLLPWRTAIANVELGLEMLDHSPAARREVAQFWLTRLGLASHEQDFPMRSPAACASG